MVNRKDNSNCWLEPLVEPAIQWLTNDSQWLFCDFWYPSVLLLLWCSSCCFRGVMFLRLLMLPLCDYAPEYKPANQLSTSRVHPPRAFIRNSFQLSGKDSLRGET